jgi:NTP pyrophosphatase (non-canonical NTP hydrolase)
MNVIEFAVIMQEKLDANDHKTHWNDMSLQYLFTRLAQETKELSCANAKKLPPDDVDREAADVANFAMMIADNYREKYAEERL